jgi:FkbM family methyltransferase
MAVNRMDKMGSIGRSVRYTWRKEVTAPLRRAVWSTRKSPFVHSTPAGARFMLYPGQSIDKCIFVDGAYEIRFLQLIERFFSKRSNCIMIDIGANIGNHAIYLASVFDKIYCFEPAVQIAERLESNISLNGFSNVEVHRIGLSDRNEFLHFKLDCTGNLGASHFQETPDDDTIELPVRLGDQYLADIDRIDFIKVDAERHEREVFRGLRDTIAKHRPIIAFELHGGEGEAYLDQIRSVLQGYLLTEPTFAPWKASRLAKFIWQIKGRPTFPEIRSPQPRFYENVIAFPNVDVLNSFECSVS